MASFELLDRAANGFQRRLRLVTDAQRMLPTPCPEFNVHDLVAHQIRGMRTYTLLLHGVTWLLQEPQRRRT
jgi:Mycothiol maleylpyruvate isomerase N-terminal domain